MNLVSFFNSWVDVQNNQRRNVRFNICPRRTNSRYSNNNLSPKGVNDILTCQHARERLSPKIPPTYEFNLPSCFWLIPIIMCNASGVFYGEVNPTRYRFKLSPNFTSDRSASASGKYEFLLLYLKSILNYCLITLGPACYIFIIILFIDTCKNIKFYIWFI